MAIDTAVMNGRGPEKPQVAPLDASKLRVIQAETLKPIPARETLVFGHSMTDHMVLVEYHPETGWTDPVIKPYGPLSIDPISSCLQYSTNLFEGMKAYYGPDGEIRLFRPQLNMARMERSRDRVALPAFDTNELLKLIQKLVTLEARWIPQAPGYSLYIRPTMIGTRAYLGVAASDHAALYVVCCPTGPYFRTGARMLSLKAVGEHVRSWPGGTGGYKLSGNYSPTFMPQQEATHEGYDQVLWLIGDRITEAGAMNFFIAVKRDDGDIDVITPPLDGTILPGVTRDSVLHLVAAHGAKGDVLKLPNSPKLHAQERTITMAELAQWATEGRLVESFSVGTAVVVAGIGRIGSEGREDILMPKVEGPRGLIANAIYDKITAIQEGRELFEDWSVVCQ